WLRSQLTQIKAMSPQPETGRKEQEIRD
ncbi:MAG: hypothetical protein QOJ79_1, partial [Actinomycetota bacterium]|nr:hypothetical protein [Actinomycetota bacterium]